MHLSWSGSDGLRVCSALHLLRVDGRLFHGRSRRSYAASCFDRGGRYRLCGCAGPWSSGVPASCPLLVPGRRLEMPRSVVPGLGCAGCTQSRRRRIHRLGLYLDLLSPAACLDPVHSAWAPPRVPACASGVLLWHVRPSFVSRCGDGVDCVLEDRRGVTRFCLWGLCQHRDGLYSLGP